MPSDFFRKFGGRRMSAYADQPILEPSGLSEETGMGIDHGLEKEPAKWEPVNVMGVPLDDAQIPVRFVDGSHIHETIAWLRDQEGHPVPVVLAELGGICVRSEKRRLVRECEVVERVVSIIVDCFPWHEVEAFAGSISEMGLRLLPARPPEDEDGMPTVCYDFERMREQTRVACLHEMASLEEVAWRKGSDEMTLVDGRLGRFHYAAVAAADVVGVIKRQSADYLHDQGWRVLYALEPGQRTPAFALASRNLPVVTWYLKLDGARGAMPNWGVVRVEIPRARFDAMGSDFRYVDRLSRGLLEMRCRQGSYARAPVSLEPIVRAEESLKALFTPMEALTQHFYHETGL